MDSRFRVVLWLNILFALFVIGLAILLLLKFREPFQGVVVALLIIGVNHIVANSFQVDATSKELARRLGLPEEEDKVARRADALHQIVNMALFFVIDLMAIAAIITALVGSLA